ncbi:globin-2B isoform X3 [Anthonomus grandis grandis]|nr:globin-2B isoform X3 [Anthonomus grandis grandis]XP_050299037.1 globin-2B isoform X3 [Anthonomus grandis grandis]XP_050299038.1 globin-2B isoform X3 [Anthonomus grandis grandis]XP_050299039.1 globin-2B isoform X3 [Anthonomus grandis grandis]XP_050299040.1 globin-2B isoform X3 [Anthonomus grandis grandis]
MGVILSFFWHDTGRTDDPDRTTGLTSRDRHLLKTTWKTLSNGEENLKTGMAIFMTLFKVHPEYQQLFPFRNVPYNQLESNNRFKAHCISLMYAFTSIMENLDNVELLEQLLGKQGVAHVSRKVPERAYWDLKEVLMQLFQKSGMSSEELEAWNKFLDYGLGIMVKCAVEEKKGVE